MMTLNPSVKDYNVNGHISPDGKQIAIDRKYYVKVDNENKDSKYYIASGVYNILSEEEVSQEIKRIVSGRVLSEEEKVQIGISGK